MGISVLTLASFGDKWDDCEILTVALQVKAWLPVSGKLAVKWRREVKFTFATEKRLIPQIQSFTLQKGKLVNV